MITLLRQISRNRKPFLQCFRCIYIKDGIWSKELTNDVKKEIESYWKDEINKPFPNKKEAEKYYLLSMFPYPSGNLHMGHVRVYTISDAIARFLRMNGKKVIHPIGWDAFGLPAENAAIERNIYPSDWTKKNIATMKQQLKGLNISFDWDTELTTCDASYYKWTQYLFLLMFEKGLAYKKEDLYEGLSDPSLVEWRDAIKIQKHWIGEPDGYIFHFKAFHNGEYLNDDFTVWTNAPELVYGASFVGVSPNHHFNSTEFGGGKVGCDQKLNITVHNPFNGLHLPVIVSENLDHSSATDSFLGVPDSDDTKFTKFVTKHRTNTVDIADNSSRLKNSGELSGLSREEAKSKILDVAQRLNVKVYKASKKLRDWLISRQRYWGTPIPVIYCTSCKVVPVDKQDLPVQLPELVEFSGKSSSLKAAQDWANIKCPRCGCPAKRETDTMDTFVDSSWYFLRYLDVENQSLPFSVDKVNKNMPVDLYIGGKEHAGLHMFYARFMSRFLHSVGLLRHPEPFLQLLMQGMVMGKSYRIKDSGKYVTKDEVDFSGPTLLEKFSGSPVIEDWEKMSKSKYNGVDPQKVIDEHGIDTARLFILGSVAPQSPRKWNEDLFPGIQNWQWRLWLTVADFLEQQKQSNLSRSLPEEEIKKYEDQLCDARNFYVKGITHNFINTRQLSVAIAKLQGLTGELRRIPKVLAQSHEFGRCLGDLIIMLAPLAPHFSSELWSAYCGAVTNSNYSYDLKSPVLLQNWPKMDVNCNMQINIKLNGDDCDCIPISRLELLNLSEEKAISIALSREKVLDNLNGAKVKYVRYKIWPDYDPEVQIIFKPLGKKSKKYKPFKNSMTA
ncbi:probable leucine--tRNA ligase, mitochondrial isoform X2 [Parasteatoda tepidariorum]|uniref:probable leucine--tRNA ligase, mitochondrial isoform X2 n=1 Tax=Parasteatoda tepidariorum TaxID=114398 RepID=UPI001C72975C|nr:probable leucine--tRNA ligase, mitochondrial isoform X2 [Parasteatoda tepidariorum]